MTHPSQPGLGERKCAELRAVEVDGVDASQRIDVVSDEYEKLTGIKVGNGDTISFVVDSRLDPENDEFAWDPVIKCGERTWTAKNDFAGPAPEPLGIWARYAQVLFETNEFSFVD